MTMGHRLRSGSARRGIAFISTAALLTSMMAVPAFAEHRENTDVLEADDAIGASIAWSDATFDSAETVIIGRDDVFADNLASGVLQGLGDGSPLLLTDTAELDEETEAEIEDLGAENAYVLGGEDAISGNVVEALEDLGLEVTRLSGETRVETAIAVAEEAAPDADSAIIARADEAGADDETRAWADSLAAGAWAAESGMPVLLTQTNDLNDNLADYLEGSAIESVTIVGGTSAVSAAVASEIESLGIDVDRVSGATRFETAVAVAEARGFDSAADADEVILVEGQAQDAWASGFAAAAYSALNGAPIVLSNGEDLPEPTVEFLEGGDAALVCGPMVEDAACDEAAEILGHEEAAHTNAAFDVAPSDAVTAANATTRQYTVSGITLERVDIILFECNQLQRNADGIYTFTGNTAAADNDTAAPGNVNGSTVSVVNGVAGGSTDQVVPQNGSVSFTVTGPAANTAGACVEPVVVADADDDDAVDIGSNNQPSESFGVGGETDYTPAAATSGAINNMTVSRTFKDVNKFAACPTGTPNANCVTYAYDANDTYSVGGTSVGIDAFEAALSGGDTLTGGTYTTDPAGVSNFPLTDAAPAAPASLTTSSPTATSVTITFPDSATATTDAYRIYRLQSTGPAVACPDTTNNTSLTTTETPARTYTLLTTIADKSGTSAADAAYTHTDSNLTPNTRYCYIVRAVDDGDESSNMGADGDTGQAGNTSAAASNPGAPQITNVNAQDAGLTGTIDAGDVHQFIFNQPMAATLDDAGSTYRLQDNDATPTIVDIVCGTNATCVLQPAGTYNGTAYAANQVMRVQITTTPAGAQLIQAGSVAGAQYPATITAVTAAHWRDADENLVLDLAGSPDKVVDAGGTFTPAANTTAPTLTSALADESANTVTVTMSEPVTCANAGFTQWAFTDADDAGVNPTAVACNGTNQVTLTFAAGQVQVADAAGINLAFNDDNDAVTDANDVIDLDGNPAADDATVPTTVQA